RHPGSEVKIQGIVGAEMAKSQAFQQHERQSLTLDCTRDGGMCTVAGFVKLALSARDSDQSASPSCRQEMVGAHQIVTGVGLSRRCSSLFEVT
ncbi:MAG TPA: hypothetical protein VF221_01750, partial [Chloroflexota bacterium]